MRNATMCTMASLVSICYVSLQTVVSIQIQGLGTLHSKYSCREVIYVYDFQVNCMLGHMYPNVVSIDNGPYFVLSRDLTVKYDLLTINNLDRLCGRWDFA